MIPEGEYTLSLYNDVIKKAVDAAKMGRHILCTYKLISRRDELLLSSICEYYKVEFMSARLLCSTRIKEYKDITEEVKRTKRLYRPEASVVFVGELYGNSNGKDITLTLANYFLKLGFNLRNLLYIIAINFIVFLCTSTFKIFSSRMLRPPQKVGNNCSGTDKPSSVRENT